MVDMQEVNLLNAEKKALEQEADVRVVESEKGERSEKGEIEEHKVEGVQTEQESEIPSAAAAAAASTPSAVPVKDPILVDVENLLSEDLTDMYLSLPDESKLAFRQKGEETATKIQEMIRHGKIKTKKILDLIREWLQMIPGVNKFFLEQEAKIKTDKMVKYASEQAKSSKNIL